MPQLYDGKKDMFEDWENVILTESKMDYLKNFHLISR